MFILLVLFLTACCACAAANTEYALEPCSGKLSLNEDTYIILTPANLGDHSELVASLGKTAEELTADWKERGVQLQAWTKNMNSCLEVTVIQDEDSLHYYDLERQNRQVRNEYLSLHRGSGKYAKDGFTILKPAWKKQKLGGNFLKFEYKRTVGEKTWRGVARKTIRNGYTIMLDYQVYDRLPRRTDEDVLNRIANTVEFESREPTAVDQTAASVESSEPVSASASGLLQVSVAPPAETNSNTFTIEGHTSPGAHLIGVAMRWSSSTPYKFLTDASKAGNFKLKVTLPEEGVWLVTLNLEINGTIVAEEIFNTTTYSKSVLPVTFDSEIPEQLVSDELVISGVTDKGVTIQCIVTNGESTYDQSVRTNGTGKFRFKIPTSLEAEYDITLAFSKKNLDTKRLTFKATRSLTVQDTRSRTATKAIHPSYNALTRNLNTYIGTTMAYEVHVVDVQQVDEEWIIKAALKKNRGVYSSFLYFMAKENPGLEIGSKVKLYGTCVGAYQEQSEEGDTSYPGFDYLFYE